VKILFPLAALAAFAQSPAPAPEPAKDAVVLVVGDEKLTRADWENLMLALPDPVRMQAATPEGRRRLAEQLAEIKALAQEARREQFHNTAKTKAILQIQLDQTLASQFMQHKSEHGMDDAAVKEAYGRDRARFTEANARHILIRFQGSPVPTKPGAKDLTEAEALAKLLAVKKRVEGGEDFATVAKAESDDSGSGAAGGELGTFGPGQMVKEFEDVAFALEPGKLSEPVKTRFGYHLIQVKERRAKPLAEVRPQLEQQLRPEFARKFSEGVKQRAKITLDEGYFGKPASAAIPVPPTAPAGQPATPAAPRP
jgi:peptidyl-prolyl cis-trans isomerase C